MVEGVKRVTKALESSEFLFKDGKSVSLPTKQKIFLTRGHKYTGVFSFPAAVLRTLHRRMLREGMNIDLESFRKLAFVLEIKGMRGPDGQWIQFN